MDEGLDSSDFCTGVVIAGGNCAQYKFQKVVEIPERTGICELRKELMMAMAVCRILWKSE